MNDLIYRQTAVDALKSMAVPLYKDLACEDIWERDRTLDNAIEKMVEIPSVDAVPVIRCKDCKYMTEHYDTDGNVPYWTCSEWDSGTDYDGFCHYAERRTNET